MHTRLVKRIEYRDPTEFCLQLVAELLGSDPRVMVLPALVSLTLCREGNLQGHGTMQEDLSDPGQIDTVLLHSPSHPEESATPATDTFRSQTVPTRME